MTVLGCGKFELGVVELTHPPKAFPLRGRWHGEAVTDEVSPMASSPIETDELTLMGTPHQSASQTASPSKAGIRRIPGFAFGETEFSIPKDLKIHREAFWKAC